MAIIKGSVRGSRQDELVVTSFQPEARSRRRLLVVVALLAIGLVGFVGGWYGSIQSVNGLTRERDDLNALIEENQATIAELSQQLGILRKGGEVDRVANDDVRETIRDLRAKVSGLEEEVRFYRGIMIADDGAPQGLRINRVDLRPLEGRSARYSIILSQVAETSGYIAGSLSLNVVGTLKGKEQTLALHQLDKQIENGGMAFRFRYFQELSGELLFPAGFVPARVEITVQSTGKKAQKVEQSLDWPT